MKDQRGVIYLETLIAFLPVFLFFLATLQIADLSAAHIIVRHAATVAARAAVVVMPDDGRYYNDESNEQVHRFDGLRREDIELAADRILRANPRLDRRPSNVQVGFSGGAPQPTNPGADPFKGKSREQLLEAAFTAQTAGAALDTSNKGNGEQGMREQLDALVTARYRCMINFFCPRDVAMVATASLVYQGARYIYEAWPDSIRSDGRPDAAAAAPVAPATPRPSPSPSASPGNTNPTGPIASNSEANQSGVSRPSSNDQPGSHDNTTPGSTSPNASTSNTSGAVASNNTPGSNANSASGVRPSGSPSPRPAIAASAPNDSSTPVVGPTRPGQSGTSVSSADTAANGGRTEGANSTSAPGTAPSNNTTADSSAQTGTNTAANSRNPASNPTRGPAPTRGPPGSNTNSEQGTQGVIAGAVADDTDSTGPTIAGANASNPNAPQPSASSIVANGPAAHSDNRATPAANSGRTPPGNAAELRAALPPNLRNVPIVRDPNLRGSTVRVHYTHDARGRVTGVEIRVGDGAQARHITDHVNTVDAMQRYQGLAGRARALLERFNAFIAGRPNILPGTLAWETRREVEKLNAIIASRTRELEGRDLTDAERAEYEAEIASYQEQLDYYEATLPLLTDEAGRGYVAANDNGTSELQRHYAATRGQLRNFRNTRNTAGVTEQRGEHDTALYMQREARTAGSPWYGYEMARGYRPGDGFDQIWVRRQNGQIVEILVVEAKGRNARTDRAAKLGESKRKGPQMSSGWVYETAHDMMNPTSDRYSPADRELAEAIIAGMDLGPPPVVRGIVVTGSNRSPTDTHSGPPPNEVTDSTGAAVLRNWPWRFQRPSGSSSTVAPP